MVVLWKIICSAGTVNFIQDWFCEKNSRYGERTKGLQSIFFHFSAGINHSLVVFLLAVLTGISPLLAKADDIDLFFRSNNESTSANVLFILDTSGSMASPIYSSGAGESRMTAMKAALTSVIRDLFEAGVNVNIGISVFPRTLVGSYVLNGFQNTSPGQFTAAQRETLQQDLIDKVNSLTIGGGTPINTALWDAKKYFYGETPAEGSETRNDPNSMDNGQFISPISSSCQTNHIILFSDGAPEDTLDTDALIQQLALPEGVNFEPPAGKAQCSGGGLGSCAIKLSKWFFNKDHSDSVPGMQNIRVHTIALTDSDGLLDYLTYVASTPKDTYRAASSDELSEAIISILSSVVESVDSIAPPSLSVNSFNSLQNRDHVYYSLFEPNGGSRWRGNVKRYRMKYDGTIVDVKGELALNEGGGGFSPSARSWWASDLDGDGSPDNDGDNISVGGFATAKTGKAGLFLPNQRNVYTWWGGSPLLSNKENHFPVDINNDGLQASEFVNNTENQFRAAMQSALDFKADHFYPAMLWLRGGNNSQPHGWYPDVIHNSPALVNYHTNGSDFDDTLFVGSNLGFLHAINPTDGEELFAFMPKELLSNGYAYFLEDTTRSTKNYGLDAPLQVWRHDANGDGNILTAANGRPQAGEFIHVYQAMRRGGKNIYALDVSARNAPKMLWQITGGIGEFQSMGQSWSVPKRTRLAWCPNQNTNNTCDPREVLVFGGGYDPAYDDSLDGNVGATDEGNAIYIVDAITGEKLWSAGHTSASNEHRLVSESMKYSVVADVTPVDINSDGMMDILIAVDIQGQVWRFDFPAATQSASASASAAAVTGGVIARLSSNQSVSDKRRYYHTPDVSLFIRRGSVNQFLAISVASGYRTKPRDTSINDKLSVIIDRNTFRAPDSYDYVGVGGIITMDNLVNINALTSLQPDSPVSATSFLQRENTFGLYLDFVGAGEKALSSTTTFAGEVLVSSFTPPSSTENLQGEAACRVRFGDNTLYRLNLNPLFGGDSSSATPNSPNGNTTINLVKTSKLSHRGLPPQPQVLITSCQENCPAGEQGQLNTVLCVGLECTKNALSPSSFWTKTYWREEYTRR